MLQMLTGHGCFGHYLHHRARREPTPRCHHCPDTDDDTAQHTLVACPAWVEQCAELCAVLGLDLTIPAILSSMVRSREAFEVVSTLCESVLLQKEAAERDREAQEDADPMRRRRGGRRRAQYERQLPP
ncbi:uncharacterized protein LOC121735060 [Aricia agestis]|uniref:uncharacterized protein LOC121735060 n=1 Tax=Aricia agestis TaxID=91739 RepID=UPI001C205B85|nr:uncharacterized protein LOC121735060 [Aricia agestis]